MIKQSQIIECAEELGYVLEPADADDVLSGSFEGETVYGAVTDWLNAFETCADFDAPKYKQIKIKWRGITE
jgi:hypothetical protein